MKSALLDTAPDGNRMRVCTGTGPTQTEGRSFLAQRARGVLPDPEAAIDRCNREAGLLGSLEQVEKGGGQ